MLLAQSFFLSGTCYLCLESREYANRTQYSELEMLLSLALLVLVKCGEVFGRSLTNFWALFARDFCCQTLVKSAELDCRI